jgi:nicotinamide riboside transporter PnuC
MNQTIEIESDTISNPETIVREEEVVKKRAFWLTYNFWVESIIFVISVLGAICIAFSIMKGFILWGVSNSICIIYFIIQKQYPLALQQFVFLGTTVLGIIQNYKEIFTIE